MYRLLVVDDEEKIRVLVRKYAEYEGYEVEEAADGMSAIELCRQEKFELLFYLVRNRGIALTREKLINDVWGYDFFGDDRTLDTHIKLLRKALGEYSRYIVTLRGVGYRFEG